MNSLSANIVERNAHNYEAGAKDVGPVVYNNEASKLSKPDPS